MPGERRTTEGKLLRWKMLFVKQKTLAQLPYPFFIEWDHQTMDDSREQSHEVKSQMQNRDLQITSCCFQVHNPKTILLSWQNLLETESTSDHQIIVSGVTLQFVQMNEEGYERMSDVIIRAAGKS